MSQPYTPAPPTRAPQPQRPFHWGRWALWTLTAAVLAFAGFGALGYALRDDSGDPAACKAAMRADFQRAIAAGADAPTSDRPAACNGIDDATVQRYASELVTEQLGDIEP